ncbi:hypothetical protein MTR_6g036490 [Medicago truncatula]|uniref:Transmembrane protein n=1 Tax=Medicago truncatula TaxID=3880 RepID=G7KHR0_MEDTR|nr:hypothetical protein MTR_6g036490 [Medicago truncatula]
MIKLTFYFPLFLSLQVPLPDAFYGLNTELRNKKQCPLISLNGIQEGCLLFIGGVNMQRKLYQNENLGSSSSEVEETDVRGFS